MDNIEIKSLFDVEDFYQKDLLNKHLYPWEVISALDAYVDELAGGEKIIMGEGSSIDPSAKVEGKVIVGKNVTICDGVLIRGNCIIGDNVRVGHCVELKHSVIMNNTALSHFNYVGDSIVGNNVNIGGGAIVANWRFDKKNIMIKLENEKIDTGLEKFGAAIGDRSSIGVNSVLNPGTILGKSSTVYPLVSVSGVNSSGSVLK